MQPKAGFGYFRIKKSEKMKNLEIRDADIKDAAIIADFNARLAQETESRELDPDLINPGVMAILNDGTKGRYWLALVEGKVAGQIMITYEWSDWRNGTLWWIQSVYVCPEQRKKGVFSALYRYVEDQARQSRDACGIRLYVENGNSSAQQTYLALGMKKPGYQVMEVDFRKTTGVLDD